MPIYPCPNCGERIQVDDSRAGRAYVCPLCGESSLVPGKRPEPAEPAKPTIPPGLEGIFSTEERTGIWALPSWILLPGLAVAGLAIALVGFALLFSGLEAIGFGHLVDGSTRPSAAPPAVHAPAAPTATVGDQLRAHYDAGQGAFRLPVDVARAAFDNNPVEADATLQGQTVIVSGRIEAIQLGMAGGKYLDLRGVMCHFDVNDAGSFTGLQKGQLVTVRGVYSSYTVGDVVLKQCSVLEYSRGERGTTSTPVLRKRERTRGVAAHNGRAGPYERA